MSRWVRVARVADLSAEHGRFVAVADHELALFLVGEGVIAVHNSCPHAGGNLAAGPVRDGCVTCPWHHWEFDLRSGACPLSPDVRLKHVPARVEAGEVWVEVP